jgi:DNA-binding MarR family transcriptional regulator
VTYLLGRTAAAAGRRANEKMTALGIDTRHYAVLAAIADGDGPSQQDVAAALGIDRATLVALADDLEALGLIRRARSDSDRRAYALALTADGAGMLTRGDALMDECEEEFTGVLAPAERAQLADLLTRLFTEASPAPGARES